MTLKRITQLLKKSFLQWYLPLISFVRILFFPRLSYILTTPPYNLDSINKMPNQDSSSGSFYGTSLISSGSFYGSSLILKYEIRKELKISQLIICHDLESQAKQERRTYQLMTMSRMHMSFQKRNKKSIHCMMLLLITQAVEQQQMDYRTKE